MSAPIRDKIQKAIEEGDAAAVLAIGLHCRFEADRGNVCQCAEPEHVSNGGRGGKGDLMCGICGLQDQAAKAIWEDEFYNHAFVESDDDFKRKIGWCGYCTFKRDHPNHQEKP